MVFLFLLNPINLYLKTPEIYVYWKKWLTDTHSVLLIISRAMATKFHKKRHAGSIKQEKRKGKHNFYVCRSPVIRKRAINVFWSFYGLICTPDFYSVLMNISENHVIQGSCNVISGNSSLHFTTLSSLGPKSIVIVEI